MENDAGNGGPGNPAGRVAKACKLTMPAFHVLAKPVGPICNLDCKYCFYLEKEKLYPEKANAGSLGRRTDAVGDAPADQGGRPAALSGGFVQRWAMPDDVLESFIRQYIEATSSPVVSFAW